jgi:membrane protein
MAEGTISRWNRFRTAALHFLQEKDLETAENTQQSRAHRFAHFWLLVFKSFARNRCPVRASALAYTTLLALVPLLAVAVSITTGMLQRQGKEPIERAINELVGYVAPALDLEVRDPADPNAPSGRDRVVAQITGFISNINTGTLGTTSVIVLLFFGISLLRTIEAAFNDIWGVTRGRGLVKSVIYYWAAITLGPIMLAVAITLTTGPHLEGSRAWLDHVPFLGTLFFYILPFVLLTIGFSGFYAVMPNTKVHWKAALIGGTVGGCLWQLNNISSVFYMSRVQTYKSIYGGLAVVPLFLLGLYFSWLIILFGAQVAYAFQNRRAYVEERQGETVNQRGREFIALRLMTLIALAFERGERPPSGVDLARTIGVPSALACKLLCNLADNGILVEVTNGEIGYMPARPLDHLTVHDVLVALRVGQGQELATKEDGFRVRVRSEFERVLMAEQDAGSRVTLRELIAREEPEPARRLRVHAEA